MMFRSNPKQIGGFNFYHGTMQVPERLFRVHPMPKHITLGQLADEGVKVLWITPTP
jgi:hypothetical protein